MASGGDMHCITYKVKRVSFFGREVPVIMQNENGPCPLLGIANVLLLRNTLQLPSGAPDISQARLLALIAEYLLDSTQLSESADPTVAANQQQNISDAISHLPKLTTGLDVNVKFDKGPHGFEFTDEVAVFDLLGISLVHGWLLDPKNEELAKQINGRSYNELVCWLVPLIGQNSDAAQRLLEPSPSAAAALAAALAEAEAATGARPDTVEESEFKKALLMSMEEDPQGDHTPKEEPTSHKQKKQEHSSDLPAKEDIGEEDIEAVVSQLVHEIMIGVVAKAERRRSQLGPQAMDDEGRSVAGMSMAATAGDSSAALSPLSSLGVNEAAELFVLADGTQDEPKHDNAVNTQEAADAMAEGLSKPDPWAIALVQNFLDLSASQLTEAGIAGLHESLRPNELAVFFRNNHFSTIFNHEGSLYILVTDVGYLHESEIVWERLDSVHGSTTFFTAKFAPFVPHSEPSAVSEAARLAHAAFGEVLKGGNGMAADAKDQSTSNDTDADYALALALQQQMQEEAEAAQLAEAQAREQRQSQQTQAQQHRVTPQQQQQLDRSEEERRRHQARQQAHAARQQQQQQQSRQQQQQPQQQRRFWERPAGDAKGGSKSKQDCIVM